MVMMNKLLTPVLVLNANFEPINICTSRRALGLMVAEKAITIENGGGSIKTVSKVYSLPSIIRLNFMIKRPRPKIKLNRHEIFRRDFHTCQYCGKKEGKLTIDHVVPKHENGSHSWDNLVTACAKCNLRKGGTRLQDTNMRLKSKPIAPAASMAYIFGKHIRQNSTWKQYIEGW